jgi:uncharacterized UBP type Zn finger protein
MLGPSHDRARHIAPHPCHHVTVIHPVMPHATDCHECLARGEDWVELWLCLSCGWVACSNDSPNQHAKAHYQETDHPIAVPLGNGPPSRWCYVHQRIV